MSNARRNPLAASASASNIMESLAASASAAPVFPGARIFLHVAQFEEWVKPALALPKI